MTNIRERSMLEPLEDGFSFEKLRKERRSAEAHASELLTALRGVLNFPRDLDVRRHAIEIINQVIREACEVES